MKSELFTNHCILFIFLFDSCPTSWKMGLYSNTILLQAYYRGEEIGPRKIFVGLLCTLTTMCPSVAFLTVDTGLPSYSPQVLQDRYEGLWICFSESLTAAEGAGSILLFVLAVPCARIQLGLAELCHTVQRGHR